MLKVNKVLGIDFGQVHVGFALLDVKTGIVFRKGGVSGFKNLNNLFEKIREFCQEHGIDGVVFGVPYGKGGEKTEQALRYERIGGKLRDFLREVGVVVEFFFFDEAFSTFDGERVDVPDGVDVSDHEMAAVVILERFYNEMSK